MGNKLFPPMHFNSSMNHQQEFYFLLHYNIFSKLLFKFRVAIHKI